MAVIKKEWNAGQRAVTAAVVNTLVWTSSDIAADGVVYYSINLQNTGLNTINELDRLRLKAGGQTIWDLPIAHFRAFFQRMSRANYSIPTTDTRFKWPLYIPDAKGDERYDAGFPAKQAPTLEVVTLAGAVAGNMDAAWGRRMDKPLKFWHAYLSGQMNIGASVTNGRFPITTGGLLRGFSINTAGLNRAKLVLGGVEILNLSGAQLLNGDQAENITTLTNPTFVKLDEPLAAPAGTSYVELDTAAGWAGTANELGVYAINPQ